MKLSTLIIAERGCKVVDCGLEQSLGLWCRQNKGHSSRRDLEGALKMESEDWQAREGAAADP